MRIKLVMKDIEYSKALINAIRQHDQNLFVEVGEFRDGEKDCMIVTDHSPRNFSKNLLNKYKGGIVFLLTKEVPESLKVRERGPFFIFKYAGVNRIMYELNFAYSFWSGDKSIRRRDYSLISVFSDFGDERSKHTSNLIARQLAYRYGINVLILPMTYLNDYSNNLNTSKKDFLRLMYYIEEKRVLSEEVYFVKDNYNVEYFRLPSGINCLAKLDEEKIDRVLDFLGNNYMDFIILDFGTAYTDLALNLIKESKYQIFVESSQNMLKLEDVIGEKRDKVISIDWEQGKDSIAIKSEDIAIKIFDEQNEGKAA